MTLPSLVWLVAWQSLPGLAARLPAPDAAAELAKSTRALRADPVRTEKLDPDPDVLARVAAACRRAALGEAPAVVRLDAMECAANLGDRTVAGLLLHVDDPTVRAGAAPFAPRDELYEVVRSDPAPLAAAAAAVVLCTADPIGTLARLGDQGRARLRALAANATLDRGEKRAIRMCLRK